MTSSPTTSDLTVVYYTASAEREEFETGIIRTLKESVGNRRVISVSQRPLDFGRNICVGQIGVNEMNAIRQALLGVREAQTKYVALTESDCLFPASMFEVIPPPGHWCYPDTAYLLSEGDSLFWPKKMRELVGVTERENAIRCFEAILSDPPAWVSKAMLRLTKRETFSSAHQPAITIKTSRQMHSRSPHGGEAVERITYWGTADDVFRRLS